MVRTVLQAQRDQLELRGRSVVGNDRTRPFAAPLRGVAEMLSAASMPGRNVVWFDRRVSPSHSTIGTLACPPSGYADDSAGGGGSASVPIPHCVGAMHVRSREQDAWGSAIASGQRYDAAGRSVEVRAVAEGRARSGDLPHERQQAETLEQVTRHTYVERREPDPEDYDGPYVPVYLVDRVATAQAHEVDGTGAERLVGEERSYYDGTAHLGLGHPDSGTAVAVVRGLLSCRLQLAFHDGLLDELFHDAPDGRAILEQEGRYLRSGDRLYIQRDRVAHDGHGNVISSLDPLGHESFTQYDDAHGLFPARLVNPVGQVVEVRQGALPFLVVSWTDPTGNVTDYGYDPSGFLSSVIEKGRLVDDEWEGDPPTHPTELFEVDFTLPVSVTTRKRLERAGGTVMGVRYLDGAGQTIQVRTQAEPHPDRPDTDRYRVSARHVRDHKGQVLSTFPAVFAETAEYGPVVDDAPATTTTYDPLGRPVRIDHATAPLCARSLRRGARAPGIGTTMPASSTLAMRATGLTSSSSST